MDGKEKSIIPINKYETGASAPWQDDILSLVKQKQLEEDLVYNFLREEKIKIYEDDRFYLIKSNQFKDWTITQARNDAREEIGLILKSLPQG